MINFNFINNLLIRIGLRKPRNKIIIEAGGSIKTGPKSEIRGFKDAELRSLKDINHQGKINTD
jgi:hypothetical protein